MINKFDKKWLISQITTHGKGEKIKTNCPKDGVAAYVWRMTRFFSGQDVCLPMTAHFKLADQIEHDHPGREFHCGILGWYEKGIMDILDLLVDEILDDMKLVQKSILSRWRGLI